MCQKSASSLRVISLGTARHDDRRAVGVGRPPCALGLVPEAVPRAPLAAHGAQALELPLRPAVDLNHLPCDSSPNLSAVPSTVSHRSTRVRLRGVTCFSTLGVVAIGSPFSGSVLANEQAGGSGGLRAALYGFDIGDARGTLLVPRPCQRRFDIVIFEAYRQFGVMGTDGCDGAGECLGGQTLPLVHGTGAGK